MKASVTLNIDKTNYVIFQSAHYEIPPDVTIKIGNKVLSRATVNM